MTIKFTFIKNYRREKIFFGSHKLLLNFFLWCNLRVRYWMYGKSEKFPSANQHQRNCWVLTFFFIFYFYFIKLIEDVFILLKEGKGFKF